MPAPRIAGGEARRASQRRGIKAPAPVALSPYAIGDAVSWTSLGMPRQGTILRLFDDDALAEVRAEGRKWRVPIAALVRVARPSPQR
jgi:hypothetical protein